MKSRDNTDSRHSDWTSTFQGKAYQGSNPENHNSLSPNDSAPYCSETFNPGFPTTTLTFDKPFLRIKQYGPISFLAFYFLLRMHPKNSYVYLFILLTSSSICRRLLIQDEYVPNNQPNQSPQANDEKSDRKYCDEVPWLSDHGS